MGSVWSRVVENPSPRLTEERSQRWWVFQGIGGRGQFPVGDSGTETLGTTGVYRPHPGAQDVRPSGPVPERDTDRTRESRPPTETRG